MVSEEKTIRLRGSDGEAFEVSEKIIAAAVATVKGMIEEGLTASVIPPGDDPSFFIPIDNDDPLAHFDDDFVRIDNDTLVSLVHAANFLNIDGLLDLACKVVAEQMRGRTINKIHKKFDIVNDYTKEEEEEIRRENSWAFE